MSLSHNAFWVASLALLLSNFVLLFQRSSSPPLLYQTLEVPPTASATEIEAAYFRLHHALWISEKEGPAYNTIEKLIDVQHAYDTLSDKRRRRNYDTFLLDELEAAVQRAKKENAGVSVDELEFPLWHVEPVKELGESATVSLTSHNFNKIVLESDDVWVIQLYSEMSIDSQELLDSWDSVAMDMAGVAQVGRVEIGQIPLLILLAEKTLYTKQPRFGSGLPEIVVFTSKCRRFDCLIRYRGLKTKDALIDWVATSVLKLPRILYYSFKTLMKDVIQGAGTHKVKVLLFSGNGERAAPYLRQAAKKYWEYAVFAKILFQEQNATFWESRVGVKSAPALVFVKDPGLKPVVFHGVLNSSYFETLIEEHKAFVLPQLRRISAEALGCDARRKSVAGNSTTWYCVIVAGRTGPSLSQVRGVMREVLQNLTDTEVVLGSGVPGHVLAAEALKSQRLSLSWLDGDKQRDFCYVYLHSPTMFEACGPRRNGEVDDVPKIFLVRYQRKLLTIKEQERIEKNKALRANNPWISLLEDNDSVASQLVSKYEGSATVADIVQWVSQMVYEGDNNDLPSFSGKMPELLPEESLPFWAQSQEVVADGQAKVVHFIQRFMQTLSPYTSNMSLVPVVVFLAIFLSLHFFLHLNKFPQLVGHDPSAG